MTFALNLRRARTRAHLSLRELSDLAGGVVSHQAIKKYEDGEMYPSAVALVAIGNALGVSLDSLMSEEQQEEVRHSIERSRAHTLIGASLKLLTDNDTIAALTPIERERYLDVIRLLTLLQRETAI